MRPSWDEYFLNIAVEVAKRSTCVRKQVGCLLVRDNRILATGYGGSIPGQPHCLDAGCDIDPATGGCQRTTHAELNALIQCAKHGVTTDNATAYITLSPCWTCFKALAGAGVRRIVYKDEYRLPPAFQTAKECGIDLVHFTY